MQKRNELNVDDMAAYAEWYFKKHFKTYSQAAEYFKTSSPTITHIVKGIQSPNQLMLEAFGYDDKESFFKRSKK